MTSSIRRSRAVALTAALLVAVAGLTAAPTATAHGPGGSGHGHGTSHGNGHGNGHGKGHDRWDAELGGIYVDPQSSTVEHAAGLEGQAREDALRLARIPSATWFTDGTPRKVRREASDLVTRADKADAVPVLVAYNIPYRDCSLYSAGGAADGDAYARWIEGLAAGIGKREAIVVVEPDGLGVIPWHEDINGNLESCRPDELDPATAADQRFAQLSHAVDVLSALPRTKVYLDGTGSSWLSPGDAAIRLTRANVAQADGFFINVSNYESDARLAHYASWVSDCLALTSRSSFPATSCQSQYWPATFDDTSTWNLTDATYDQAFADQGLVRDVATQKHAILDTSRNGQGSWAAPAGKYTDAEVWCNPPGRGLGQLPNLDVEDPYVDARLWIKVPGESDGECFRGTGGPLDPERGMQDPAAGAWFPEQARELIELANPALPAASSRPGHLR
ncbi:MULTISPECIES: glycoside hydrolase family 6 protein [unclassified Isoptericola]|uniref:glycoside hydrolase family 6 protein n=1 Tax=Isoptericola sp. NPDC060185 TaxID=3347065 RepID=UPI0036587FD9